VTIDRDRAGRRRDQTADNADHRRLAGPVRAQKGKDLALLDFKIDGFQRGKPALIGLRETRNGYD
jgi:hypothetical protein